FCSLLLVNQPPIFYYFGIPMVKKKLAEIELKTRDILENTVGSLDKIDPPVDVAKILEFLGISLSLAGFKKPDVSGAYDEASKMIYLNKSDSKKRQLFTVAHELGHIILNHKKKFDIFYRA